MADKIARQMPTSTNDVTHETIHPSVLRRKNQIPPQLQVNIDKNPALICGLLPLEEEWKQNWPYIPGKHPPKDVRIEEKPNDTKRRSFFSMALQKGTQLGLQSLHEITHTEVTKNASGDPVYEKSWLGPLVDETPFGGYLKEWTDKK